MELDYSISEFINDSQLPQISCILKHRYTDFIVHEISMDGIIVSEKLAFDEPRKEEKVIERPAFMTDEIMKTLEGLNESDVFSFKLPVSADENFANFCTFFSQIFQNLVVNKSMLLLIRNFLAVWYQILKMVLWKFM